MDDLISRQAVKEWLTKWEGYLDADMIARMQYRVIDIPNAQPEVAKRIVGMSRDGMTMWYQCDVCGEPVDLKDAFCSGCGRRLVNE